MTGPDPAVARVRLAIRSDLARIARADGAGTILVACSGGPDSLALAAGVAFEAPRAGFTASAVIVDHGLQAGSADVAHRAAQQCTELGLPADVVRVAPVGDSEAAARAARYTALTERADALGARAVLLGHSLDDQAEQVLLALARGSGSRSLAGMPPVRGLFRRPLLDLRRSDLAAACTAAGLEPWHDPTNHPSGGGARRSRVRHEVLPLLVEVLGPGVAEALARTASALRTDADFLDTLAAGLVDRARSDEGPAVDGRLVDGRLVEGHSGEGRAVEGLSVNVLAAAPPALRGRAIRAALLEWGAPAGALHAVHVRAVESLITDWTGQGPIDVPGLRVSRCCGRLVPG